VASIFGCCLIRTLRVPDQASDKSTTPPRRSIIARRRWVSHRAPEISRLIYVRAGRAEVQKYFGAEDLDGGLESLPGETLEKVGCARPPCPPSSEKRRRHIHRPIRPFGDGHNATSSSRPKQPYSSQNRSPQSHLNARMTDCLSGKCTVPINLGVAPQMRHSRLELSSISPIFSALNISIGHPHSALKLN